jgi:hypothetical protein
MTFPRFKCTPPKLNRHLDGQGRKILFQKNVAFKVELFQLGHPKCPSFFKYFYVLGVYGASIYIAHHYERMTNNMGQTCGSEKHFIIHTTLEPFSSHNIILK